MALGIKLASVRPITDAVDIDSELDTLQQLKTAADQAKEAYEDQQAKVVRLFQSEGRKTRVGHAGLKATLVERKVPKYDESGLAKALGATVWNKVTKKVLDRSKLEKAVDDGVVDVNVVAQYATIQEQKPTIRLSLDMGDTDE